MIKIENVSTVGWEAAIRGARNPMNSWDKSDSLFYSPGSDAIQNLVGDRVFADPYLTSAWLYSGPTEKRELYSWAIDDSDDMDQLSEDEFIIFNRAGVPTIGPNDLKLLSNLAKAGSDEAKFRRMIVVYADITAPMYWWKECDTYKVGTVRNSCSTMHKIHAKEFTLEDFSTEHLYSDELETLEELIQVLNGARELYLDGKRKEDWWQMIQLLPSSYNQRATLMLNYEVLANMYHARKNHKLDCWREFCGWIETLPYAEELIVDAGHEDTEDQLRARFKSYENRIEYLEITMAKELYSSGMSTLDISEKIGIGESTIRKIVEENKS